MKTVKPKVVITITPKKDKPKVSPKDRKKAC